MSLKGFTDAISIYFVGEVCSVFYLDEAGDYVYSNYFLLNLIGVLKYRNDPAAIKPKRIKKNIPVFNSVPNPIAAVKIASIIKAHIKAPPFSIPVTCASPIGNAT